MNLARNLISLFAMIVLSMQSVFAVEGPIMNALDGIRDVLTNDAVISGLSILFIFWGLYALFFWATRIFAKSQGHQRVRVAMSVVLSFFVGSFFILSLRSAGDKLGYVAAAWIVLFLLIGIFFMGIFWIYKAYFGNDSNLTKAKNWTRITLFVLSLLVFLLLYSLVFTKISYVIITDGTGSFSVFSSGSGVDASIEDMLGDVERRAQSQGGISGGIIGLMASIISSIFSFVFGIGMIALLIVAGVLITRHFKGTNPKGGVATSKRNPKGDMREIIKHIAIKLDDINASFANKLQYLKLMKQANNKRRNSNSTSSTGIGDGRRDPPLGDIDNIDLGGNK